MYTMGHNNIEFIDLFAVQPVIIDYLSSYEWFETVLNN